MTLRNMTALQLALPPDLLDAVDEHRFAERISSRQEAMRRLLRAGLEAMQRKPPDRRPGQAMRRKAAV
jgi:metal-responsive CopG/Arc/MetJ family transcriptional regulator